MRPGRPDNIAFVHRQGDAQGLRTLAEATRIVHCELVNNRVIAAPMETRVGRTANMPTSR